MARYDDERMARCQCVHTCRYDERASRPTGRSLTIFPSATSATASCGPTQGKTERPQDMPDTESGTNPWSLRDADGASWRCLAPLEPCGAGMLPGVASWHGRVVKPYARRERPAFGDGLQGTGPGRAAATYRTTRTGACNTPESGQHDKRSPRGTRLTWACALSPRGPREASSP